MLDRAGEAALKKPVTFVRLRRGPGSAGKVVEDRRQGVLRGAAAGGM